MNKHIYLLIFISLVNSNFHMLATIYVYLQNDTGKEIDYDENKLKLITPHKLNPGQRKSFAADYLQTIDAKFTDGHVYRQLNLGTSVEDARKGINSIVHIIPGVFGVKVGSIDKVYDDMSIPLEVKMEILRPLGLNLRDVDVPRFSKSLAAKILNIDVMSSSREAEDAYLNLAKNRNRALSVDANNYRAYLLNKALRTYES